MAYASPNMGLSVWNLNSDRYDHDQLADNMARIDAHDHAPGRGHPIPTEAFNDGSITSAKLANAATVKAVGCFSAYRNAALAAVATGTEIVWDTEEWDFSGWHDVGTGRFTPQVAGYYRINASLGVSTNLAADQFVAAAITKNGTNTKLGHRYVQPNTGGSTTDFRVIVTGLVAVNGTTDYISIKTVSTAAIDLVVGLSESYFQGELVGRS